MKTYKMIEANGAEIAISSTSEANRVMAGFEPFADKFLAEVDVTSSIEAEPFAFIQRVAARWNANCAVLREMEADDELKLAERKAVEKEHARAIRDMARKCRDGSNGSQGQ